MKIAIDSGPLTSGHSIRGIGTYTRELLKALEMKGIDVSKEDLSKYDIVHFTSFKPFVISLPFSKPKNTKFVLTIYDLIPLIYPDHYPPGIKGKINWLINKWLIKSNVDAIITISETSKKDICRFLGINPNKVFVIYLAPKEIFKKLKNPSYLNLPETFALYVGDLNYNKNIPSLLEMCEQANIKLVMVGKQAKNIEDQNLNHPELKHLKNLDWSNTIRLGFVEDEDLVHLYNLADVYIQPSLYEGFSLPVLEAEACGTWVIATKIQVHEEIIGRSREFTWDKTAKETLNVYEKI